MQCTRIDNLLIVRRVSFANDHLDRRKIRALHRLLVDAIERCLTQPIVRQHGNVDRAVAGREDEHRDIDCRVALEAKTSRALLVRNAVFLQEHGDAIGAVVVKMQANGGMFVGGAFEHRADESRLEIGEEPHRLDRRFAKMLKRLGLIGAEQTLMLAQRIASIFDSSKL